MSLFLIVLTCVLFAVALIALTTANMWLGLLLAYPSYLACDWICGKINVAFDRPPPRHP